MHTFPSKLISKKQLTSHVFLFQLSTDNAPDFTFQAGQYIIIHVPQPDGSTARRLYSIASPPSQKGRIELVIEIVPDGVGSQYVAHLTEGDEVTLQGPAGLFTLKEQDFNHSEQTSKGRDPESTSPGNTTDQNNKPPRSIVFLATGTGIAPIRSMIHELLRKQSPQHPLSTPPLTKGGAGGGPYNLQPTTYNLFWGLKHYTDTYFLDEFIDLARRHDNFSFTVCLSQEQNLDMIDSGKQSYFHLGRMTGVIDGMIGNEKKTKDSSQNKEENPDIQKSNHQKLTSNLQSPNPTTCNLEPATYYICGGRQVVEGIKTHLLEKGISKDQLHFEKF